MAIVLGFTLFGTRWQIMLRVPSSGSTYLVRGQRPAHWICASRQLARVWHITTHWRKNRRQNRETCQDHHPLQYSDRCPLAWQRTLSEPDFPGRLLYDHNIVH